MSPCRIQLHYDFKIRNTDTNTNTNTKAILSNICNYKIRNINTNTEIQPQSEPSSIFPKTTSEESPKKYLLSFCWSKKLLAQLNAF